MKGYSEKRTIVGSMTLSISFNLCLHCACYHLKQVHNGITKQRYNSIFVIPNGSARLIYIWCREFLCYRAPSPKCPTFTEGHESMCLHALVYDLPGDHIWTGMVPLVPRFLALYGFSHSAGSDISSLHAGSMVTDLNPVLYMLYSRSFPSDRSVCVLCHHPGW